MAIRIVTDSTADLPAEVAESLGITVVPLYVHFGDEQLRDGVDISSEEFFERLQRESRTPTTSQPPAGAFRDVYRNLAADGSEIVSIHVSSKLSGTFASAQQGAAGLEGTEVRVVDSGTASMALGMAAIAAVEAAGRGASIDGVVAAAEDLLGRSHMLVIFDTLKYLRRGGRIGRGMELIGTLARLKPIATVRDGEVAAAGRVRTKNKAIEEVLRRFAELRPLERAGIVHATTPDECDYVAERLRGLAPEIPITQSRIGPVLGVHAGPGVLGATVVTAAPATGEGSPPTGA